ncbi:MAG TPA: hypothetical protein VMW50_13525 [Dehalococcoidia bacterium]|nr:hypothetical protein [Dehalococcoidia bacterium]
MVLVASRPLFELFVDRKVDGKLVSVSIKSRWPQARTDRSLHQLFQINLTEDEIIRLAEAIKGGD